MAYVIGIDGGGSTVRAVVVNQELTIFGQSRGPSANPNVVGQAAAAQTIQASIVDVLKVAGLSRDQVEGVGIGVAGAAQYQSWLHQSVIEVMPDTQVVVSTDYEIALVGAHGRRQGALVLAGTGSLAYAINAEGQSALAGGWGYLLGDEGGGYWLGLQALRSTVRMADRRGQETSLAQVVYNMLHIAQPREITKWLYHSDLLRVKEVAALAPLVLAHAENGDRVAREIVGLAAEELALATEAVLLQLEAQNLPIAFTGSLLSTANPLTNRLCKRLGLDTVPRSRYPPSVGAGLLALALLGIAEPVDDQMS